MRRYALLGLTLLLPGCQFAGNPLDGFGGFVGDTHTISDNPNAPSGDSINLQRVRGNDVAPQPLLPEPGNIWPGAPRPDPTLEDIEREQNNAPLTTTGTAPTDTPSVAHAQPRGSSVPPGSVQPGLATPPVATPRVPPLTAPITIPAGRTVPTPQGTATINRGGNGVQTYTMPNGTVGTAVPNANGTVTLIGPDGSVQTAPASR